MLVFKRNKNRYVTNYKMKDVYNFYKSTYTNPVTFKMFHKIFKEFFPETFFKIILEGGEFTMPYRLGDIRIRKRKRYIKKRPDGTLDKTKMPVDWAATKKMWEEKYPNLSSEEIAKISIEEKGLKYNWNEHTDRFQFKPCWEKFISNVPNRNFYVFKLPRTHKEFLAKALKENKEVQYLHLL